MKRTLCLAAALLLSLICIQARADIAPVLIALDHTCASTAVASPASFDPYARSWLVTVAAWEKEISFIPTVPGGCYATVNGEYVPSGAVSRPIELTDSPVSVTVRVSNTTGSAVYTVFVQRRPSEKRTKVSAGYIRQVYEQEGKWYIAADLVTVNYASSAYADGGRSSYINDSSYLYHYPVSPGCVYYYTSGDVTRQCMDVYGFLSVYAEIPGAMYRLVYIEDEIVAVLPYRATY